jgi:hypothetical protein
VRAAAILLLLLASPVSAYTVGTGFSEACHERMTLEAYSEYIVELPTDRVPVPSGAAWNALSAALIKEFGLQSYDDAQRTMILSLVIGVRAPDTEGHALTDFSNTRRIHADASDEGQYAHALRGIGDDGVQGDQAAVQGTREYLRSMIARAHEVLRLPRDQQLVKATVYVEGYGLVEVPVWGPLYFMGRAIHALQDSFTHMLRDETFGGVTHVMNYVEAIGTNHQEPRDGVRHSQSMDTCGWTTAPLQRAAVEATIDLILSQTAPFFLSPSTEQPSLDEFLDRWLRYKPNCDFANAYCQSRWLPVAQEAPTHAYLSCGAAPGDGNVLYALVLVAMVWMKRRATRQQRTRALAAVALACALTACPNPPAPRGRPVLDCSAEPLVPCGGDLSGSWAWVNVCPFGGVERTFSLPGYEACPEVRRDGSSSRVGTVTFDGGVVTGGVAFARQRIAATIPKKCIPDVAEAGCANALPDAVCADRGDVCRCSYTSVGEVEPGEAVPYTLDGGYLIMEDLAVAYCVQDDLLTLEFRTFEDGAEVWERMQLQRLE